MVEAKQLWRQVWHNVVVVDSVVGRALAAHILVEPGGKCSVATAWQPKHIHVTHVQVLLCHLYVCVFVVVTSVLGSTAESEAAGLRAGFTMCAALKMASAAPKLWPVMISGDPGCSLNTDCTAAFTWGLRASCAP